MSRGLFLGTFSSLLFALFACPVHLGLKTKRRQSGPSRAGQISRFSGIILARAAEVAHSVVREWAEQAT